MDNWLDSITEVVKEIFERWLGRVQDLWDLMRK